MIPRSGRGERIRARPRIALSLVAIAVLASATPTRADDECALVIAFTGSIAPDKVFNRFSEKLTISGTVETRECTGNI